MRSSLFAFLSVCLLSSASNAREPITIYLAGDSTLAEKLPEKRPETGWGEKLQAHFDARKVRIENHAKNGRSTRTFLEEGRWAAIADQLKPGDYVFIQFGHNDASVDKTDRYAPPAVYRNNLIGFVAEVRAKRARPVLFTPVARRRVDEQGKFVDGHGEYPDIVRNVAREFDVPLIDMHRSSGAVLERYGVDASKQLFLILPPDTHPNYPQGINDNTHFSPLGAEEMAQAAVTELKAVDRKLANRFAKQ
jgi:lysophospholipase L1-like esterase